MSTFAGIVVGGILIPLAAWWFVRGRRQRDPLLLPILVFAMAFTIGGLGATLAGDDWLDWKLVAGIVLSVVFVRRWRAAGVVRDHLTSSVGPSA